MNKVYGSAAEALEAEAMKTAHTIAGYSKVTTVACKDAVDRSFETGLTEGVALERRIFAGLFSTHDQKEGMAAFVEKRAAVWERDQ